MLKIKLLQAVITSRVLHLFYQHCHNLTFGTSFVGDHTMLDDFYHQLADDYDRLAEYTVAIIGNKEFDTTTIHEMLLQELSAFKVETMSTGEMFVAALVLENKLSKNLIDLNSEPLIGLQNMIGDIAEQADIRIYKIQQRLK